MHALYEEFLNLHNLNNGAIYRVVLPNERKFKEVTMKGHVKVGKAKIPVSENVLNAVTFIKEVHLAQMNAEKAMKQWISMHVKYRLELDDVERLCQYVEQDVLKNLLWPFQMLCEEDNLKEEAFYPIAAHMEQIVLQVFHVIDTFYDCFMQNEAILDQRASEKKAEMNRQTDAWAANAPVRVRGSARVVGDRIHIYAKAESTVTQGQVLADYQVNNLLAYQQRNRDSQAMQKDLLHYMHDELLSIIKNYVTVWKECIQNVSGALNNISAMAICSTAVNALPQSHDNANKLYTFMKSEDDFWAMKFYLNFYQIDLDEIRGEFAAATMYNNYVKTKNLDPNELHYAFYCYFYEVEAAVLHDPFFKRIKEIIKRQCRNTVTKHYNADPEKYKTEPADRELAWWYRFIDAIDGGDEKKHRELVDACRYVFYDVTGNASMRDIYDEKNPVPVFDFNWDK